MSTDDPFKTGGAFDALPNVEAELVGRLTGRVLSGYKVDGLIGSGGMGFVLHATRTGGDFDRVAAIKVVPTTLGSSELAQRFRTEVQILAKLNHANIAQLYDAGETSEGWPYLVMEYVDGSPIDTYCDDNNLSVDDRVQMLIGVVRALRFAHARLIVHRDLKPSNVMIDANGKPKLLDFGIAKLLEPDTAQHTVGHRPMTPQYASPEQLLGADITIGSDIYQLGLLFLSVIANETPFESTTLQDAIRNAAAGQDATISVRAAEHMHPDLMAIIVRCLHSDPDDRYSDVNALLNDLLCYENGFPVEARKGTQFYRLKKLIRRNVPATVFAVLSAMILIGGTAWYTINIDAARRLAEDRAETSNRVLQALSSLVTETFDGFIDLNADRQFGTAAVVESVLRDTVAIVRDELSSEPEARIELLRVQGNIERTLGDYVSAAKTFDDAAGLLDSGSSPDNLAQILLSRTDVALRMEDVETGRTLMSQIASILDLASLSTGTAIDFHHLSGKLALAEKRFEDCLAELDTAIAMIESQSEPDTQRLTEIYVTQTVLHGESNDNEQLLESAAKALALLTESESEFSSKLVDPLRLSARAHVLLGDLATAREMLERSMTIARGNYGDVHRQLADVHHTYGLLEYYSKDLPLAVEHVEEEIRIIEELYGSANPRLQSLIGNLALLYTDIGESEKAIEMFELRLRSTDINAPENRVSLYHYFTNKARMLRGIGDYEKAIEANYKSLGIRSELYGPDSIEVTDAIDNIALSLYKWGRYDEARNKFIEALERYRGHFGEDSDDYKKKLLYLWRYDIVDGDLTGARDKLHELMMEDIENDEVDAIWPVHMFTDLAHINLQLADFPRALQALDWAKTGAATAPRHPWALYTDVVEAEIRLATGEFELARVRAEKALSGLRERFPKHTDRIQRAQAVLNDLPPPN